MATDKDIPYLLKLIDDDSPIVQNEVQKALLSFGQDLELKLKPFIKELTETKIACLRTILTTHRRHHYKKNWYKWLDYGNRVEGLEKAMGDIAYLDYGFLDESLFDLLDKLELKYREKGHRRNVFSLMHFLFVEQNIGQPNDYYNPLNSNLIYTIKSKQGTPISLTCLAILLGNRLGIEIHGINFPGHFLCRSIVDGKIYYFDCFQKGRILTKEDLETLRSSLPIGLNGVFDQVATNFEIVLRVLKNIAIAYNKSGNLNGEKYFDELAQNLQKILDRNYNNISDP